MPTWTQDSAGENLAKELGITLSPIQRRYPLSKVNIGQGLRNQARIDAPLNEEYVIKYCRVLDNGGALPAVFITKDGKVWAGNHRLAAAKRQGLKTIGVYIMTPPAKGGITALESFKRRDNIHHGQSISAQECLMHAITMSKAPHFLKPSQLARDYNLTRQQITQGIRADAAKVLLRKNKIDVDWSIATYDAVNSLNDDKIELAVGRLAHDHDLSQTSVVDLVKEIKARRTSDSRLKVVERWEDDIMQANTTTNGHVKKPQRTRKRTQRELDHDRAKVELLGPRGFFAFIMHGNTKDGGGAFQSFNDLGVDDPKEIEDMTASIKTLVQTLNVIKASAKGTS